MIDIESIVLDNDNKIPVIKPELKEGTKVFISNKQHKLYLETATIVGRDHRQYRIEFTGKKHTGKKIWIHEHWVDPIPKKRK